MTTHVAPQISDNDREQWLAERRSYIGASEVSVIAGVNPWMDARTLYKMKRGEWHGTDEDLAHLWWGRHVEPVIAARYTHVTGRELVRAEAAYFHPDIPHLRATADFETPDETVIVETKDTNYFAFRSYDWGDSMPLDLARSDEPHVFDAVPPHYLLQTQTQMGVAIAGGADIKFCDLVAHVGQGDIRIYRIVFDARLFETIVTLVNDFWTRVVEGDEPPVSYVAKGAVDTIKAMYPGTSGMAVALEGAAWQSHVEEYDRLGEDIKRLEARRDVIKAALTDAIGDNSIAVLDDGTGFTRYHVDEKEISYTRKAYHAMRRVKSAGSKAVKAGYIDAAPPAPELPTDRLS